MCHEAWWRERRARRLEREEPEDLWRDFERIWPEAREVADEQSEDAAVDAETREPATIER